MEGQVRYYSQFFRISYRGPPPQTPSTWQQAQASRPPSYDEVLQTAEQEDSMRLPTYQSRPLRRYHPYWPFTQSHRQADGIRFENTIYDDQCVLLEVPARVGPPPSTPPLTPWGIPQETAEEESTDESLSDLSPVELARRRRQLEDERWARAWRLRAVLGDFMQSWHRARSQRVIANPVTMVFLPMPQPVPSQPLPLPLSQPSTPATEGAI